MWYIMWYVLYATLLYYYTFLPPTIHISSNVTIQPCILNENNIWYRYAGLIIGFDHPFLGELACTQHVVLP
jgi:hypothetical protein